MKELLHRLVYYSCTYHTPNDFDSADPNRGPGVREVMGSIPLGDSYRFLCPTLAVSCWWVHFPHCYVCVHFQRGADEIWSNFTGRLDGTKHNVRAVQLFPNYVSNLDYCKNDASLKEFMLVMIVIIIMIFIERHFPMVQSMAVYKKKSTVKFPVGFLHFNFLDGTNFDQHAIFYHQCEAPMDLSNLHFIRIRASATLMSIRVDLIPMQSLGPAPSGRNWKAWMESSVQT